jgi:hypothetical protein
MSTATELGLRIAAHVRDASQAELTGVQYLGFINDAVVDLNAVGWLLPLSEDNVAQVAATFEYTVPASFAYVKEIRLESVTTANFYDEVLPDYAWTIAFMAATPKIRLDSRVYTPAAGKKLLVIGQKRAPSLAGSDTITAGLESFLRERAIAYTAINLSIGDSEYARLRQAIAKFAWEASEQMVVDMPEEFRIVPGSRPVPGR